MDKNTLIEEINLIDNYFDRCETIPCIDAVRVIELVNSTVKERRKELVHKVTNLKLNDNWYQTLQSSYTIINKEIEKTLSNLTDENIVIVLTQYKIVHTYHQFLDSNINTPYYIIREMNDRVIDNIGKSSKVFKKINYMSR